MTSCPICAHRSELCLARRPRIPLLQNRVWPDVQAAVNAPSGRLSMMFCNVCHFAWNADFDPSKNIYDDAYDNDQMQSRHFRDHAAAMMGRVVDALSPGHAAHLVEVGCGQGMFLKELMAIAGDRLACATGFDPALKAELSCDRIAWKKDYFNETSAHLIEAAEIVVSRHTIEHTPDPLAFLKNIRACMFDSPTSRLLLETPDIDWIIDNLQDQDLFYEHCSIFSRDGLAIALHLAGFDNIHVDRVFGDQYLWAQATPRPRNADLDDVPPLADFSLKVAAFAAHGSSFATKWRGAIVRAAFEGEVWLWGGASKGVTFALLVDPECTLLSGAIDINDNKAEQFMPVTGLRIRAPEALPDGVTVIVMNENYLDEIRSQIKSMGKQARLLTLT